VADVIDVCDERDPDGHREGERAWVSHPQAIATIKISGRIHVIGQTARPITRVGVVVTRPDPGRRREARQHPVHIISANLADVGAGHRE